MIQIIIERIEKFTDRIWDFFRKFGLEVPSMALKNFEALQSLSADLDRSLNVTDLRFIELCTHWWKSVHNYGSMEDDSPSHHQRPSHAISSLLIILIILKLFNFVVLKIIQKLQKKVFHNYSVLLSFDFILYKYRSLDFSMPLILSFCGCVRRRPVLPVVLSASLVFLSFMSL